MPITQDRMLALIEAAGAWQDSYTFLCQNIEYEIEQFQGHEDVKRFIAALRTHCKLGMPIGPVGIVIERERWHFRRNKGRNERNKRYLKKRRRADVEFTALPIPTEPPALAEFPEPKPVRVPKPARAHKGTKYSDTVETHFTHDPNEPINEEEFLPL